MPARKPLDLGHKFGRLTVTESCEPDFDPRGVRIYCVMAQCDCGAIIRVREASLRTGNTKSCGCFQKDAVRADTARFRHGMAYTRTHRIWRSMLQRSTNPKIAQSHNYSGRGISVCERWRSFENFVADMGECPPRHSIDRINNDGNYEPSNCRWASKRTQSENTSQVKLVQLNGESMSTAEAMRRLGFSPSQIVLRMKTKGETREQALDYYIKKRAGQ